jgi:ribosomal-protein-serine acetyltransferase
MDAVGQRLRPRRRRPVHPQSEQDWESGVAYQYAITTSDAVIGSCGLMRRIGPGGLEIGYWLHPAYTWRVARSGAGWVGGAGTRAVGAGGWSRGHSVAVPATSATAAANAAVNRAGAGEARRMVSSSRAWLDRRPSGLTGGRTARCRAGRRCWGAASGW